MVSYCLPLMLGAALNGIIFGHILLENSCKYKNKKMTIFDIFVVQYEVSFVHVNLKVSTLFRVIIVLVKYSTSLKRSYSAIFVSAWFFSLFKLSFSFHKWSSSKTIILQRNTFQSFYAVFGPPVELLSDLEMWKGFNGNE